MEQTAQFLWGLLDDIDTASDIAKGDDKIYREMVERIQRRRFEIGSTDGYTVKFNSAHGGHGPDANDAKPAAPYDPRLTSEHEAAMERQPPPGRIDR